MARLLTNYFVLKFNDRRFIIIIKSRFEEWICGSRAARGVGPNRTGTPLLYIKSHIVCPEFQTGVSAACSPLLWHGSRLNYWFSKRLTDRATWVAGTPASYSVDPKFEPQLLRLAVLYQTYINYINLNVVPPSNTETVTDIKMIKTFLQINDFEIRYHVTRWLTTSFCW